ncbi:MAG: FG-GAP-like repeat-containing protein [Bacteroidota bacterium]|nr:FG-GAP-like repeat-containing protein [Bacteroidota bacterium]
MLKNTSSVRQRLRVQSQAFLYLHPIITLVLVANLFAGNAYSQVPVISSFKPLQAKYHDHDTIVGLNFHTTADSNFVSFGGVAAKVLSASATTLVVEVPLSAQSDYIYVSRSGRMAISKRKFNVVFGGGRYIDQNILNYVNAISTYGNGLLTQEQIAGADFNNDNAIDFAVVIYNGPSRVYGNNRSYIASATSFPSYITINDSTGHKMMRRLDINSDGKQDLVVINKSIRKVYVFRNKSTDSTISFHTPDTFSLTGSPRDFDLNDFDLNGKMDLAVIFDTVACNCVKVYGNISPGCDTVVFGSPINITAYRGKMITSGDMTGDGKPDIIVSPLVANASNSTMLLRNTSTSSYFTFTYSYTLGQFSDYTSVDISDINRDGKMDVLAVGATSPTLFINTTTNPTNPGFTTGSSYNGTVARIADLDGDSFPDILSGNASQALSTFYRNSYQTLNPEFNYEYIQLSGVLVHPSLVFADLDSNLTQDIINYTTGGVSIVKNAYIKPEPTSPASAKKYITVNGERIKFKLTKGNGSERVIVARKGQPIILGPVDYNIYTANDTFGRGTMIDTNEFVLYRGTKDTFDIKGLRRNTHYYFGVYEVNGPGLGSNYDNGYFFDTSTTFEVSQPLSGVTISMVTDSSARISWTKGDGNKRLLVMQRNDITADCSPKPLKRYAGSALYRQGDTISTNNYGSWGPDTAYSRWFVMYADTGSFCDMRGLSSGVDYRFKVYEFLDTLGSAYYYYNQVVISILSTISLPPRIDSIVPGRAKPGDKVTVYGDYFDYDAAKNKASWMGGYEKDITMAVSFGAVKASFINVINKRKIEVTLPYGSSNDFVRVTAKYRGDAYSAKKFQPYFSSRDTFWAGSVSLNFTNYWGSGFDALSGFNGIDISMNGKPDYFFLATGGGLRYQVNTYDQGAQVSTGYTSPLCNPASFESNLDFDHNLRTDVLYSCDQYSQLISLGLSLYGGAGSGSTLCIHDFDRNGNYDRLVISNYATFQQAIRINTSTLLSLPFGNSMRAGTIADLNNDRRADIVSASYSSGKISILRNIYDTGMFTLNSFAPVIELAGTPGAEWIECADVDKDGREDLVLSNSLNNTLRIYRNISVGSSLDSTSFQLVATFTLPAKPRRFKVQDISGDGNPDIVISGNASTNGTMMFLVNRLNGNPIDTTRFKYVAGPSHAFGGDFRLIDANLDGRPEIFAGGYNMAGFYVYKNNLKLFEVNKINKTSYIPGDTLSVSYNIFERIFTNGNVSKVQLLDSSGNVLVYANIGQKTTIRSDTISCTMPANIPSGIYRLRVIASLPADTSVNADFTISVCGSYIKPVITSNKGFRICGSDSALFDLANKQPGVVRWFRNDTLAAEVSPGQVYVGKAGTYKAVNISSIGCALISNDTVLSKITSPLNGIVFSRPPVFCTGDSALISVNVTQSNVSYRWYRNNVALIADTSLDLVARNSGNYSVTVHDSIGCNWAAGPVSINANEFFVKLKVAGSTRFCSGDSIQLLADSNGFGGLKYRWMKNGNLLPDSNKSISVKASGIYKFRATNSNNCVELSNDTTLTALPLPVAFLIADKTPDRVCYYDSIQLMAPAGNYKFRWMHDGTQKPNDTLSSLKVKIQGIYSVRLTDTNNCSKASPDTMVTVLPKKNLSIQFNRPPAFCENDSTTASIAGNASIRKYQWYRNNTVLGNDTLAAIKIREQGFYTIRVEDTLACLHSKDTVVTVYKIPSVALTLVGSARFCDGDSVRIISQSIDTISTYQWYKNGNGLAITGSNCFAKQTGNYSLIATSNHGCRSVVADTVVTVMPLPQVSLLSSQLKACMGDSIMLTAHSAGSSLSYIWKMNGTPIISSVDSIVVATQSGDYSVNVVNADGCISAQAMATIVFNPIPSVVLNHTLPLTFCVGDSILLYYTQVNGKQYNWYRNDTAETQNGSTRVVRIAAAFKVLISDSNNCRSYSNQLITSLNPKPLTPFIQKRNDSLFSSSADGNQWLLNDVEIQSATQYFHKPLSNGYYKVRTTNSFGCSSDTSEAYNWHYAGIVPADPTDFFVEVAPNPMKNVLRISYHDLGTTCQIVIYNSLGERIYNQWVNNGMISEIDLSSHSAGVYYLLFSSGARSKSFRIVKSMEGE